MENLVIKPLGKVLKQAGLISDFQLRKILELQSKNNQVKFGTIVVSQGILKQKTVDFFAEQWPQLWQQSTTQPLGYYLQEASLIDAKQIETLLEEQKQTKLLLGELAVEKAWLQEKTVNFFLQYLEQRKKYVKLLSPSQQEIIKSFHLEGKAAAPYTLIEEVFDWTGGHPLLTRGVCQVVSDFNFFIPAGLENILVEKLVQDRIINNWENQIIGEYLKTIQEHLLNNTDCFPKTLLRLYLYILQQGEVKTNSSQAKKELIKLGLVIEQENKLKVSNRIYKSVFNLNWVKKQLWLIEKKSQNESNKAQENVLNNNQLSRKHENKNEPFTQITALMLLLGLLLIFPLVIVFNNLQHQLSKENDSLDPQSLSMSTLCFKAIPADKITQDNWRIRLEQEQTRLQEQFPDNCQSNLDKLIVLNALYLGKENRVLDGIQNLCQISATSASFNQAKFWLSRWYNSADWGEQTQSYLNFISDCPAAEKISVKF